MRLMVTHKGNIEPFEYESKEALEAEIATRAGRVNYFTSELNKLKAKRQPIIKLMSGDANMSDDEFLNYERILIENEEKMVGLAEERLKYAKIVNGEWEISVWGGPEKIIVQTVDDWFESFWNSK